MIPLPNTDSIESVADWIELYTIYYNKSISKSTIISLMNIEEETYVDSIINELLNRSSLYGDASPFKVEGRKITPNIKWNDQPEFTMCLIFSIWGAEKKKGENGGTKLFEKLSKEAAKFYLEGEAEVIGFPNEKNLRGQFERLTKLTCEEKGHRDPKPTDKDKGVDIIAWKPHRDGRSNQLILLLQCCAGIHYYQKSAIVLKTWKALMHWRTEPIPGITMPRIVADRDWVEMSDKYNLIFDRIRIYKAIYSKPLTDTTLKQQILKWCENKLQKM